MTISFDKVAQRVFQILKGRGYGLKMYQDNGQRAFDPSLEARKFFIEDEGIMVAINKNGENSEIKVYISDDTKLKEIETLLISLRQTANFFGLLYNVRKYGKKLTPKEFAFLAYKTQREEEDEEMTESVKVPTEITRTIDALLLRELTPKQIREELSKFEFAGIRGPLKFVIDEYIQEGYRNLAEAKDISSFWGTSHSSYQRVGSKQARLVVRHSQPVDEDKFAARSRHINKIFIENADGERIRFPTNYLQGARAMTRHVSMGGNFNDEIGEHIQHISEEYAVLKKFKNNAGRKLGEQAMGVINLVRNRNKEITAEVKGMQGPKSYKRYVKNFETKEQSLEEDIIMLEVKRIRKIFDSAKLYDGIDEAYIAVARLSRMNEDFDSIAEMLESGNISFTPKRDIRSGSGTHTNRNSAMLNKLYDLAERATDSKVSGFISRVAEKITNDIPMERTELNLVKGIVGLAEGTSTPVVEALDEFINWADNYILEGSPYLDKPRRSEEEARADIEAKKKKDADDDRSLWNYNYEWYKKRGNRSYKKTDEDAGSPYLNKPRRSEEEARADIEAKKNKFGKLKKSKDFGKNPFGKDEDEMEEGKPHWKKGRNRYNKQTKNIKYRKDETHTEDNPEESEQETYVRLSKMSYLALKGMIRKIHPSASDILASMPSNSNDPFDKNEAIQNLMDFIHGYQDIDDSRESSEMIETEDNPKTPYTTREEFEEETIEQELEQRSTDSLKNELSELASKKQKGWKFQKIEKELHDRNINETTDIIRFQELAGIKKKISEADPYGGSMISPYDDEPSDNDINQAHEEAEYHISTEYINANDSDEVSDLRYGTERYLDQIGLGNILSNEDIDAIIQRHYPTSELSTLKLDLVKDPILKTQFKDDPKSIIQKYQKRDS